MKRLAAAALTCWAGIVMLGWWLADRRLERCANYRWDDNPCVMRALTARDTVLTGGLTAALVAMIGLVLVLRADRSRSNRVDQIDGHWSHLARGKFATFRAKASIRYVAILAKLRKAGALARKNGQWRVVLVVAPVFALVLAWGALHYSAHDQLERPAVSDRIPPPPGFTLDTGGVQSSAPPPAVRLTPVDGDPFAVAQPKHRASVLVPDDGDPFAAPKPSSGGQGPMTTYQIRAPNGVTYQIDGPRGATEDQVRQQITAQHPEAAELPLPHH